MRHVIDLDEMLDYFKKEVWQTYASSGSENKRLDVLVGGYLFRVTVHDKIIYRGPYAHNAVDAYNEGQ